MPPLRAIGCIISTTLSKAVNWWMVFWFSPKSSLPLEIARIGIGASMLLHYALSTDDILYVWNSIVPIDTLTPWSSEFPRSTLLYLSSDTHLLVFHILFLLSCGALMVGWRTSWVKWAVLLGHFAYIGRYYPIDFYGVHRVLGHLLLILCFAPIGRAISLDRVRSVRKAKLQKLEARVPPYSSAWSGACIRLMQIQMAVIMFFSGVEKLKRGDWWTGDILWNVYSSEMWYSEILLDIFSRAYWIAIISAYVVVIFELSYPFLIWGKRTRPYMLAGAVLLHVFIAIFLRMPYFSAVMIMGHMSFIRDEWLLRLGQWWKDKVGEMEMIYDGRCGFCVRSMAWFLAFDGLRQISIRNFRVNPSPVVSDEAVEKALYLVLPGGRALPGFDAYRYVVPRVPGLFWLTPFFYVPVLSRLLGYPIYNWVASNRSRLSSIKIFGFGTNRKAASDGPPP